MPDYRIDLELAEPLFCGSRHAVSNEMTSLEFIPGTSLRGSLAAELMYSDRSADVPAWFSPTGPQWTPALPSLSSARRKLFDEAAFVVPMPLSFLREKRDRDPFTGSLGLINSLRILPPEDDLDYQRKTNSDRSASEPGKQQWTRTGANWLVVSHGRPAAPFTPRLSSSMHVGLHYGRQANRDQALFSRRGIGSRNRFVAWVRDPSGALSNFPLSTVIGKRISAGNGRASLRWEQAPFPWAGAGGSVDKEATVQLISDAILLDSHGRYLQGLNAEHWRDILGVAVRVEASAVATRRIRTWSNAWGMPRDHRLAIAAGSVFRLTSTDGGGPAWNVALDRLANQGLGRLRHEGYGWVSVNPSWLEPPSLPPKPRDTKEEASRKLRDPGPQPWPGLESVERKMVLTAFVDATTAYNAISAKRAEARPAFIQKVGELASYAARVHDPKAVITYLDGLAGRTNPRGWDDLAPLVREHLSHLQPIELVRFYLNAIETLHG